MSEISYSDLRQNLKKAILTVNDCHEPMYISNNREKCAVLVSYDDYCSLEETAYLLKSPKMAKRLIESIEEVNSGKLKKHKLLDDEA